MEKICIQCSKVFFPKKSHQGLQKYCSKKCEDRSSYLKTINRGFISRKCKGCRNSFTIEKYHDRTFFCGKKCWRKFEYNLNIEKHKKLNRINWLKNKDKKLAYARTYWKSRREKVLFDFGGKCVRCGIQDFRVLDFNHKIPRYKTGVKDKWKFSSRTEREIRNNPQNFELLCKNCNYIHYLESKKPVK